MAITATLKGTTLKEVSSDPATLEAPSAATEGIPVKDLAGLYVTIEADSTRTLSNTGNLRCYRYDENQNSPGAWVRCPSWDIAVPAAPVTQRRLAFATLELLTRRGRMTWRPDGVGVSAGSLTTYVQGYAPALTAQYT